MNYNLAQQLKLYKYTNRNKMFLTNNRLNFNTMEKIVTNRSTGMAKKIALTLLFFCSVFMMNAQVSCPLACNNTVQISMDDDCQVVVTPDMILEGPGTGACGYVVAVLGSNDLPVPSSPTINSTHVGQTLKVRVSSGSNSCWGYVKIEDKLGPIITCPKNDTVSCFAATTLVTPPAQDNCGNTNMVVRLISNDLVDNPCNSPFTAVRTLSYEATDRFGNKSAICNRVIYYRKINIDSLVFPQDRDDVELPSFSCGETNIWDTNNNGYPDVEEAGRPTLFGSPVFPNNSLCELNATFVDQRINICPGSFKVLRKWTVLDWCSGKIKEEHQIIKVLDNKGPIITCPVDKISPLNANIRVADVLTSDPFTCSATWKVIDPIVVFDCSKTTFTVDYLLADNNGNAPANGVYINDNVVLVNGKYEIRNLPVGPTWIRYTVKDECGNQTQCFTELVVVDNVPPTAVCDEFTVTTLTTGGTAQIMATTFDDGSFDNCTDIAKYEAVRMTAGCAQSLTAYAPKVNFCCEDVGKDIMVALRVTDKNNNSNTCMVTVRVQDKIAPTITCPAQANLTCEQDFKNLALTGTAIGVDNCSSNPPTFTDATNINQCGVGTVTRTWTVKDNNVPASTATCTQVIRITNSTPFVGSNINWSAVTGIKVLAGCSDYDTDPSRTGKPTWTSDDCDLIASTYEDQVFNIVDSACLKILRKWTVIDWCSFNQLNPNAGGYYTFTQVIKVNNTVGPTFTTCKDTIIDALGANCDMNVTLTEEAKDDCTPDAQLIWKYSLDAGNNGTIDRTGNGTGANPTFTGVLPTGIHKMIWTSEDKCGNKTICNEIITVRDRKKPTPYCIGELTTVIMPSTGSVAIWAKDFDKGSFDNCPGAIAISFSAVKTDTGRVFTCTNAGAKTLEMWVTDAAGNNDFCTVKINVQINQGACGTINNNIINGKVATDQNRNISNVTLTLDSEEPVIARSNENGEFNFTGLKSEGNYQLKAENNDSHSNGVTTLDLVLMQRHILGVAKLSSPYKIIAADVNNDKKISATDLVELRKLILGFYDKLPNNKSWRFVDSAEPFADKNSPFPYNESVGILFNNNTADINLKGIKIGDINETAQVNAKDKKAEPRSNKSLKLSIPKQSINKGQQISVPVTAANKALLSGLQMGIKYDNAALKFIGVVPGKMNISDADLRVNNAVIKASYAPQENINIEDGDEVFSLAFEVLANTEVSKNISLTSDIKAEAYDESYEVMNVEMVTRNIATAEIALSQNIPNPFSSSTMIEFNLPDAQVATLNVFDLTGKTIYSKSNKFNKGLNQIVLTSDELKSSGILYYQLESNGFTSTKKMILINR
jgi:hypothetical protein